MDAENDDQVDDRRAALSAAFDAVEEKEKAPAAEAPPASPAESAAPEAEPAPSVESADKQRDEKGRFLPASAVKGNPAVKPTDAGAQVGVAPPTGVIGVPAPIPAAPPAPAFKAPQSWKPEHRELASRLPPEFAPLLEEANRRERDIAVAMQKAAESQRQIEPLMRTIQPFTQGLQQRGLDPHQVLGNMLRTEQALSHPDEKVRAQVLAQAIRQYNVNVETLAQALDGHPSAAPQIDPNQIASQVMQQIQKQQFEASVQKERSELETFSNSPDAPFFNDVSVQMTALLDAAHRGGLDLTYKDAYEQACWADPRIRGILQQREASKQAATSVQATQRAHAAASSVKSTPGGSSKSGAPPSDSWRDHLDAAFERAANKQ